MGLAEGEAKYDDLEKRLAAGPVITVPTITLEGDANGAPHPEPSAYAKKFSGKYEHRLITGGIGHNLPQEAPRDFAESSLTRRCWIRLPPIVQYSPLLPPVGVWAVSQSQCGRSPSQAGYPSKPW